MIETLVDFLREQPGYFVRANYLLRPNGSVAAEFRSNVWRTDPTEREFFVYLLECGRCIPSLLCDRDLTNIGHKV
ncbi:MAG: hypothetical protein AABX32_00620 [Nanoarchaeota archaeon]